MLLDSSPEVVTVCVRPLVLACQLGRMEMVEILLEAGMDPNMVDDRSGTSPLHEAMRFYREDIAKLLLSFGANPDSENRQNEVGMEGGVERIQVRVVMWVWVQGPTYCLRSWSVMVYIQ